MENSNRNCSSEVGAGNCNERNVIMGEGFTFSWGSVGPLRQYRRSEVKEFAKQIYGVVLVNFWDGGRRYSQRATVSDECNEIERINRREFAINRYRKTERGLDHRWAGSLILHGNFE